MEAAEATGVALRIGQASTQVQRNGRFCAHRNEPLATFCWTSCANRGKSSPRNCPPLRVGWVALEALRLRNTWLGHN